MTRAQAGLSVLELIMVIVVVAIAAVGIGAAFAHMSRSLALNEDLQRAAQLAQECAEHILARGRPPRGHYAAVGSGASSTICDGMPAGSFTRVVNITGMAAAGPLCGGGWSCKRVQITVSKGTWTALEVNFMLVQY